MAETFLVRISVPREHAEVFEGLLASLPEAVVGRQAPLIDTGLDLRDSDELIVLAYLNQRPETEAVAALVAMGERLCGLTGIGFDIETLPDIDWVAESQSALTAIHAGRFFLRGSHDPSPVPAGAVGLLIDAQNAFGTGHHDTTHGCLELITGLLRSRARAQGRVRGQSQPLSQSQSRSLSQSLRPGRRTPRVLDLGAGSGVLALAWARASRQPVLGSDIDPATVGVAAVNARRNGVGHLTRFVPAAGIGHKAIRTGGRNDIVFANILSGHLINLAPSIASVTAAGGQVLLAGLLRRQEQQVERSFLALGFRAEGRLRRGPWSMLQLRNGRARLPRQINRRCQAWLRHIDFH
ncbi:MAG: 50S ribosomal protein L11 methyltransferase [Pseudomonadota bacterium]|nr:50S ribosomal protein L11 methyltransferase [Pseudomonadota bacterium]